MDQRRSRIAPPRSQGYLRRPMETVNAIIYYAVLAIGLWKCAEYFWRGLRDERYDWRKVGRGTFAFGCLIAAFSTYDMLQSGFVYSAGQAIIHGIILLIPAGIYGWGQILGAIPRSIARRRKRAREKKVTQSWDQ